MAKVPTPGTVVSASREPARMRTEWTLSNGVRVIVKPTTFQNDAIEIRPGRWAAARSCRTSSTRRFATQVVASGGVGRPRYASRCRRR